MQQPGVEFATPKTYMPVCHTGVTTFHTRKVRQISTYKHIERLQGFASDEMQEKMFGFEGDCRESGCAGCGAQ